MSDKPKCPMCGSGKHQQIADTFKCSNCGAMYDDDPNEGGDYSSDPSRRLEMQERQQERRRKNLEQGRRSDGRRRY